MTRKGGESDQDVHVEWVQPVRHGREGGIRIYVDAYTLREALAAAGIPTDTPAEDLEVLRKTMAHGCLPGCRKDHRHQFSRGRAQVLIVIRKRTCEHGLRPEDCIEHRGGRVIAPICGRRPRRPVQVFSITGPALVLDVQCELAPGHEVGAPGDPGWSGTHVGFDPRLGKRIHWTDRDDEEVSP